MSPASTYFINGPFRVDCHSPLQGLGFVVVVHFGEIDVEVAIC